MRQRPRCAEILELTGRRARPIARPRMPGKDENQRDRTTLFLKDDAKLDLAPAELRFAALLKKVHLDHD